MSKKTPRLGKVQKALLAHLYHEGPLRWGLVGVYRSTTRCEATYGWPRPWKDSTVDSLGRHGLVEHNVHAGLCMLTPEGKALAAVLCSTDNKENTP